MERLTAPLAVSVGIVDACNLDCEYCYAFPFSGKYGKVDEIIELIEELNRQKVFHVNIGGGEPFLHPKIFDILDAVFETQDRIVILSNGTRLTETRCDRLASYLERGKSPDIQISLDSVVPEINDAVRGSTTKVINAIEMLAERRLDPQIGTVVHRKNVDVALDIIDYFYPRVKRFHFMNIMPSNRVYQNRETASALFIDPPTRQEFWNELSCKMRNMPPDAIISGAEGPETSIDTGLPMAWSWPGCLAGCTRCDVKASGEVLACSIAGDSLIGDLRVSSLGDVWSSPLADAISSLPYPLCTPEGRHAMAEVTERLSVARVQVGD